MCIIILTVSIWTIPKVYLKVPRTIPTMLKHYTSIKIVYNFMITINAYMQLMHLHYLNISIPWRHEHLQDNSDHLARWCHCLFNSISNRVQSTIYNGNGDNPCMLTNLAIVAHSKKYKLHNIIEVYPNISYCSQRTSNYCTLHVCWIHGV